MARPLGSAHAVDATRRGVAAAFRRPRAAAFSQLPRQAGRRLGWGVADQAISSVTNFAVVIYVARELGAAQLGAFSLAYVTYHFALNASRGLATDPLQVRFSGAHLRIWRRAVADCTGTAAVVGLIGGGCVLAVAPLLGGTSRGAFLALGLALPGLLLQDSWRFAFFTVGRGSWAFVNDLTWALILFPALAFLKITGHGDVFWLVLSWGAAATVAAALGPLQARVVPRLPNCRRWISKHRDLGFRYMAEGTSQSASNQLRTYGISLILGLAAVGYVQAVSTLMGPFMVIAFGMGLVIVPEASRALRRSPRHLVLFCLLVGGAEALLGLTWGAVLLVALPRGLGEWLLGPVWHPTYPLLLPQTLYIMGAPIAGAAGAGLHALGVSRRSLRAMVFISIAFLVCGLAGAVEAGPVGTVSGVAIAIWMGAVVSWWQLHAALRELDKRQAGARQRLRRRPGVM